MRVSLKRTCVSTQRKQPIPANCKATIKSKITEVFQEMGWPSAKPEQNQIVEAILNRDVSVILPTGYGKSACYQCCLLHKKMYPSKAPIIVLVVSPLRALIKDQVKLYFSFYMGELLLSLKQVSALTKKKVLKHAVFLKMMKL